MLVDGERDLHVGLFFGSVVQDRLEGDLVTGIGETRHGRFEHQRLVDLEFAFRGAEAADALRHMERLRDLQRETGGFTEFVPLSFVHAEAPLFAAEPGVRPGPGGHEVVRTHALARLMLGADIPNLQVSWVKEGLRMAEHLLACGVNDLGGTLMNESISTSAGAQHGQVATPAQLRRVAHGAGRVAAERSTLYRILRVAGDGDAAPGTTPGDALDTLDAAEALARFGAYPDLTPDPRFRLQRQLIPNRPRQGRTRGGREVGETRRPEPQ